MRTKQFILMPALILLVACQGDMKIRDEQHKTFYINGVSAMDGIDKVRESLGEFGFTMETPTENDQTFVGGGITYYANFNAESLTEEQASRLTYGLFDNLSSVKVLDIISEKPRIVISWNPTGEIILYQFDLNEYIRMSKEDETEVNKRLAAMFPHSYVRSPDYGYKAYYDDNGVEVFFTHLFLKVEKNDQKYNAAQ